MTDDDRKTISEIVKRRPSFGVKRRGILGGVVEDHPCGCQILRGAGVTILREECHRHRLERHRREQRERELRKTLPIAYFKGRDGKAHRLMPDGRIE